MFMKTKIETSSGWGIHKIEVPATKYFLHVAGQRLIKLYFHPTNKTQYIPDSSYVPHSMFVCLFVGVSLLTFIINILSSSHI